MGRSEKELVGSSGLDVVHPEERDELELVVQPLFEGSVDSLRLEHRLVHPDGTVVWAESFTQLVRAADGNPGYLQTVVLDITERKVAEQARSWLTEVLESSLDAIISIDLKGVILNWNAGAERIFGYAAHEIVGRSTSLLHPPGAESEAIRWRTRVGDGERAEFRVVRRRKDGSPVTLMAQAVPMSDATGVVVGIVAVARDLGEQEQAHSMLRSLIESAPDAMVCVDEHRVIALVNARAEQIFGYARGELIGLRWETLFPGPDDPFAWPEAPPVGPGQAILARRHDGSEFAAEISLSSIPTEEGTLISATIRDGTERQQAAMVASSSDAIVGRDLDGVITSWNAGAERMYGYAAAEAVGSKLRALVPADRAGELLELTRRVEQDGLIRHYETKRIRADGVTIDVSVTMSAIRDLGGAVVGSSTAARDITVANRAVDDLRALEARQSAILESALDCIITMDHHGRVVEFNPAAEQTFGYSRDEVIGQRMADLIIPASLREQHKSGLEHYLTSGVGPILGQRLELMACRADGTEFPVALAVTRVDVPGDPLFTGFLRDLSDQRRMQSELTESEHLLEAMLDNSPALIVVKDLEGRYTFLNRAMADGYGIDRAAAKGRTAQDLWPATDLGIHRVRDLEVLRTGVPLQYESVWVHRDGPRTYLTITFPVFDAQGTAYATASISTDISASKQAVAERELLGERSRQSDRLESLGQLAGGVAHDFNNLLGVILSYAAFVADATAADPAVSADVEQIKAAAERAARLTRQLLTIGRREAIHTEVLALDAIVADVHGILARTIGEHIELMVRPGHALPAIRADRGQVEQVILNLTVNARDAMPDGGVLTISTNVVDLDEEHIRLHPGVHLGRHVELSVSDTGVGMAPEVAEHIFEPFFSTKARGDGTGLGLATVFSIVTEAKGEVLVQSEPGAGSTFRVRFPAVASDPPAPAPSPVDGEVGGQGETILIVEDELAILESTARILRLHGYVVLEAPTGSAAMALVDAHDVDLLLTDSVMPEMSGRELVARIAPQHPRLPVLFMSGYNQRTIGPRRVIDDRTAFLEKPFTVETLLSRVRATLSAER